MHTNSDIGKQTIRTYLIPHLNILLFVSKFFPDGLFLCKCSTVNRLDRNDFVSIDVFSRKIYVASSL